MAQRYPEFIKSSIQSDTGHTYVTTNNTHIGNLPAHSDLSSTHLSSCRRLCWNITSVLTQCSCTRPPRDLVIFHWTDCPASRCRNSRVESVRMAGRSLGVGKEVTDAPTADVWTHGTDLTHRPDSRRGHEVCTSLMWMSLVCPWYRRTDLWRETCMIASVNNGICDVTEGTWGYVQQRSRLQLEISLQNMLTATEHCTTLRRSGEIWSNPSSQSSIYIHSSRSS